MKGEVINETIHRIGKNNNSNNIHCTLQNTKHLISNLKRQRKRGKGRRKAEAGHKQGKEG